MTKAELTAFVADKAGITKKAAESAINAFAEGASSSLEKGEPVSLLGFGSFKVAGRAEREGRNPRTGDKIKIPAAKVVKFTPGKALKDRIK
jgi:DNA-binding protein HU-beta